jgi:hypothetical protein
MSSRIEARRNASVAVIRPGLATSPSRTAPRVGTSEPALAPHWIPWIFAAKTTAAGLLALLVAFTFDLDQPKWSLLTVFIVAQPQSGYVLAKGFYRIVGTVVGAAVALLLVSLFASECTSCHAILDCGDIKATLWAHLLSLEESSRCVMTF